MVEKITVEPKPSPLAHQGRQRIIFEKKEINTLVAGLTEGM
jgi:hypothetical protein